MPFCPPGRIDCLNVRTSDNQILTACALLFPMLPSNAAALHARTSSRTVLLAEAAVGPQLSWQPRFAPQLGPKSVL